MLSPGSECQDYRMPVHATKPVPFYDPGGPDAPPEPG